MTEILITNTVKNLDSCFIALENIRSIYNVGSILRTCSFFGIGNVILVGYSGKLLLPNKKYQISPQLQKTALGSQNDVNLILFDSSQELINFVKDNNLDLFSLEQQNGSKNLFEHEFKNLNKSVFVFGNEVTGVSDLILQNSTVLEIPKKGVHNSLNVSISMAVLASYLMSR